MTPELQDKIAGRRVVASVSGGKDSAALSLWLMEQGIEHDRVFMDTGWEHPATYEYLRGPLTEKLGPIAELRAPLQMVELIRKKSIFPTRRKRYCTDLLKVAPFKAYLDSLDYDVVSAVGIRAAESESRAAMREWEMSEGLDCEIWRPLIRWSLDEVIAIHARHGLPPNPLYLLGADRVGCWPCIHANKEEIRLVALHTPERIRQIRSLEDEVSAAFVAKVKARGEVPRLARLSFFQGRSSANGVEDIDSVVEWSRTDYGGKQFMLLDNASDAGCMRWGLCDTGTEPADG